MWPSRRLFIRVFFSISPSIYKIVILTLVAFFSSLPPLATIVWFVFGLDRTSFYPAACSLLRHRRAPAHIADAAGGIFHLTFSLLIWLFCHIVKNANICLAITARVRLCVSAMQANIRLAKWRMCSAPCSEFLFRRYGFRIDIFPYRRNFLHSSRKIFISSTAFGGRGSMKVLYICRA